MIQFQRVLPRLWRGDVTPDVRVYVHGTPGDGYWTSIISKSEIDDEHVTAELFTTNAYVGPFDSLDDALGYFRDAPPEDRE